MFEPRDIIITTDLIEQALEEYQFLNTFAEDPEKIPVPFEESFFTPPESPEPNTLRVTPKELSPELELLLVIKKELKEPPISIPQHQTLQPAKSSLRWVHF